MAQFQVPAVILRFCEGKKEIFTMAKVDVKEKCHLRTFKSFKRPCIWSNAFWTILLLSM